MQTTCLCTRRETCKAVYEDDNAVQIVGVGLSSWGPIRTLALASLRSLRKLSK